MYCPTSVITVSCSLVVTCWDRTELFVPLYVMFSYVFVTFPYVVLGQVWYSLVSIPDLLPYSFAQGHNAAQPVGLEPATTLSQLKHSTTEYCASIYCGEYNESFK